MLSGLTSLIDHHHHHHHHHLKVSNDNIYNLGLMTADPRSVPRVAPPPRGYLHSLAGLPGRAPYLGGCLSIHGRGVVCHGGVARGIMDDNDYRQVGLVLLGPLLDLCEAVPAARVGGGHLQRRKA